METVLPPQHLARAGFRALLITRLAALIALLVLVGCSLPLRRTPAATSTSAVQISPVPSRRATQAPTRPARTAAPSPNPRASARPLLNLTFAPSRIALGSTQAPTLSSSSPTPLPPLKVTVDTLTINSEIMAGVTKIVSVYLPGQYAFQVNARFKVLYAGDGQELPLIPFDQMLTELFDTRQVEPIIVVAVEAAAGDLRVEEYGAGPYLNMLGWGKNSDAYNHFLLEELQPLINTRYRTLTGPANTGIMGWSLGGLVAVYNAWQYPQAYGIVGGFSPSLWWRLPGSAGEELQARVMHQLVREANPVPQVRFWLQAGTREDSSDVDQNGVNDMIQDIEDLMFELRLRGYHDGLEMVYTFVEGKHEFDTWVGVLPNFLRWAFPAK